MKTAPAWDPRMVGLGLLATSNGSELPLVYVAAAVGLAPTGHGAYSLDALLGISTFWSPGITLVVMAAGVVGGLANTMAGRPPTPQRA